MTPSASVIAWLPPAGTVADAGDASSQGRSTNGVMVPWPASGAQSVGESPVPSTMAVLMNPSSPPRASSGRSNATVCSPTTAGASATSSYVARSMT